jgi:cell division septation protein DedD
MKSKLLLCGFAFALLFTLGSCKSKESAYKAVYERAQERAVEEPAPVVKPTPAPSTNANVSTKKEKITAVEGSGLRRFSVVIGSFINKTNASALKERMQREGYQAILAQNEQDMYRVIVASFDDRVSAADARDALKREYAPEFQDAWLLEQEY